MRMAHELSQYAVCSDKHPVRQGIRGSHDDPPACRLTILGSTTPYLQERSRIRQRLIGSRLGSGNHKASGTFGVTSKTKCFDR